MIVYPDNVWYHSVDDAALKQIFEQHLGEGQPVAAHCCHMRD
jgi:(2Fe-2S) ferredoxin